MLLLQVAETGVRSFLALFLCQVLYAAVKGALRFPFALLCQVLYAAVKFFLRGRLVGLQTVIVGSLIIRIGFLFFLGVLTIITV